MRNPTMGASVSSRRGFSLSAASTRAWEVGFTSTTSRAWEVGFGAADRAWEVGIVAGDAGQA